MKRAREWCRWPGKIRKNQRVLERFRECYRWPCSMEKARENLRGPGRGGEGQGGVDRAREG